MKNSGMIAVAIMAVATVAAHGERPNVWWAPGLPEFGHSDYIQSRSRDNQAWVHATTERDLEIMMSLVELFPPYMFDSTTHYRPGSSTPAADGSGFPERWGYYVLVDRADLTFVVTRDRAEELVSLRIMAYLLLRELVIVWTEHSGHKNVTVSIAYTPVDEDPVVFAIGFKTELGIKVVMAE